VAVPGHFSSGRAVRWCRSVRQQQVKAVRGVKPARPGAVPAGDAVLRGFELLTPSMRMLPWFPLGFLSAFYEFPLTRSPHRRSPIAGVARQQRRMSGPIRLTTLAAFPLLAYRHYAGHLACQPVYTMRN
jgi:hypothetical protein